MLGLVVCIYIYIKAYYLEKLADKNRFCIVTCVARAGGWLCMHQIYQLGDWRAMSGGMYIHIYQSLYIRKDLWQK